MFRWMQKPKPYPFLKQEQFVARYMLEEYRLGRIELSYHKVYAYVIMVILS